MSTASQGLDLSPLNLSDYLARHDHDPARALSALVSRHNRLLHDHAVLRQDKEAAERASERAAVENSQLWRSLKAIGTTSSPRPVNVRQNSEGLGGAGGGGGPSQGSSPQPPTSTSTYGASLSPAQGPFTGLTASPGGTRDRPDPPGGPRGLGIGLIPDRTTVARKVSGVAGEATTPTTGRFDLAPQTFAPHLPPSPRSDSISTTGGNGGGGAASGPNSASSPIDPRFAHAYAASAHSLRSKAATPPPSASPRLVHDATLGGPSNLRKANSLDLGRSPNAPPAQGDSPTLTGVVDGTTGAIPRTPPSQGRTASGMSREQSRESSPRLPTSASMPVMAMNERGRFLPTITPVSPLMNEIPSGRSPSRERSTASSEALQHQLQVPASAAAQDAAPTSAPPSQHPASYQTHVQHQRVRDRTFSNQSGASSSLGSAFDERSYPSRTASMNNLLAISGGSGPQGGASGGGMPSTASSLSIATLGGGGGGADLGGAPLTGGQARPPPHHGAHDSDASVSSSSNLATRRGAPTLPPQYAPPASASTTSTPPPQPSPVASTPSLAPPSPPRPTLTASHLPYTRVRVAASSIKVNEKNKETVLFYVDVQLVLPPSFPSTADGPASASSSSKTNGVSTKDASRDGEGGPAGGTVSTWRVEKVYSDILQLDAYVKNKATRSERGGLASLPDKSLFKDHAPHKSDQRKALVERYLQTLVALPLRDRTALCHFLNSDVVPDHQTSSSSSLMNNGTMQGWLTKRGRNFGGWQGWQTRYYVLTPGSCLSYYDAPHGSKLGEISLTGAAIGRQSSRATADGTSSEDAYLHAFLIRTQNDKDKEEDHILCAENDEMRDRWVAALTTLQMRVGGTGGGVGGGGTNGAGVGSSSVAAAGSGQANGSRGPDRERTTSSSVSSPLSPTNPVPPPTVVPPSDFDPSHSGAKDRRRSGSGPVPPSGVLPEQDPRGLSARFASELPPSVSLPANLDSVARNGTGPLESTASATGVPTLSSKKSATSDQGHAGPYSTVSSANAAKLQPPSSRRPNNGPASTREGGSSDRPVSPDGRRSESSSTPGAPQLQQQQQQQQQQQHPFGTTSGGKYSASDVSGPMNAVPLPSGYDFKRAERQKKTKSSFWNFAGRGSSDKTSSQHTPAPSRPVFGVPLKEAVAISRIRPGLELPAVVYRCVEYLEAKNAEHEEGIFRLSGSANVIRVLKDRFNAEGDVNLLQSNEYYDPHAIAGLLKQYLRELPVHLLTRELHPEFLRVIELRNRKDRVNALGKLVARLPIEEYTLFRFFFAHLCVIAQNADTSKMNLRNLGIVFSPTLAIPAPLFSLLLSEFDLVFAVEKETGTAKPIMVDDDPADELAVADKRRANRNSQLYQASGADKLMESDLQKLRDIDEPEDEVTADAPGDASDPDYGAEDTPDPNPSSTSSFDTSVYASGTPTLYPSAAASANSGYPNLNNTLAAQPRSPGLPSSPRPGANFETAATISSGVLPAPAR
ncbi:hypothetical protein JCM10212_004821 [Sporobolomyces blumeae]